MNLALNCIKFSKERICDGFAHFSNTSTRSFLWPSKKYKRLEQKATYCDYVPFIYNRGLFLGNDFHGLLHTVANSDKTPLYPAEDYITISFDCGTISGRMSE